MNAGHDVVQAWLKVDSPGIRFRSVSAGGASCVWLVLILVSLILFGWWQVTTRGYGTIKCIGITEF